MLRLKSYLLMSSFLIFGLLANIKASAATVAIIDSGVDYQHELLAGQMWINPIDNVFDNIDHDENGYVDDVYGWNFFNRNPHVIDYRHDKIYNSQIRRFFELQSSILLGKATEADLEWFQEVIEDERFLRDAMTYANYIHGTHVAGISAQAGDLVRIMAIRLIPTENPLFNLQREVEVSVREGRQFNWIVKQVIKGGLYLLAKAQAPIFEEIASYLDGHQVEVANASLGVSAAQIKQILIPVLRFANRGQDPSPELVDEILIHFLDRLNIEQASMMRKAPDTLFVFAAGNDGLNNDIYPTAPASIQHPHVISVAAAHESGQLAEFSNFGMRVDIAAEGVSVDSSIPNNKLMPLSGTSQAAPLVAGVAAQIKAINPNLSASEVKKVLMDTVDFRPELKGMVKSAGILNAERSLEAAQLSLSMPLSRAIAESLGTVDDQYRPRHAIEVEGPYLSLQPASIF